MLTLDLSRLRQPVLPHDLLSIDSCMICQNSEVYSPVSAGLVLLHFKGSNLCCIIPASMVTQSVLHLIDDLISLNMTIIIKSNQFNDVYIFVCYE